ncbi:MAG: F0F1 ATP synthase subunit B [Coriobacteriales bacterium]|jgi:F-type H+-transporting ATPase subunit b|nr:F0F1 ATP synthase subunit B [Coriobacteriales bacterium]
MKRNSEAREAPINAGMPDSELICPGRSGANWPEGGRAMINRRLPKALRLAACGLAGVFAAISPVLVFATEATESVPLEENEANPLTLLIPNPGEFIPMLVGFIVLWVLLAKFAWPTITGMLDKRVETIKGSLEQAENAKTESERLLAEHKAQLDEAKKQSAQIIADAKTAAELVRAEITAKAQEEAQAMLAKASAAIEAEKKAAIAELQGSVASLSVAVAGRVIGTQLSEAEHRSIIERYLVEAGSFDAN